MNKLSLISCALLLAGCQAATSTTKPATAPPLNTQPALLSEFQLQMQQTQQEANQGDVQAQQRAGRWLASAGQHQQAEPLLRAAAQQQQPDAQYQLGMLLSERQHAESQQWLEAAAERGHSAAQQQLARNHRSGKLIADKQQAFNWLLMAAQQGDAQAQNDVGAAYSRGDGVQKDAAQAAKWYRKAAEQRHALAQFNLAGAYQAGEGIKAQPALAFAWYSVAINNSRDARLNLIAEQMKLRMYAVAARVGKAAQAREAEKQLAAQFVTPREENTL